ncbi:hypothetical protein [Paenibacillus sp. FSL E2-0178]|uniref:hypothetical protein n=1 Tax=Paenibacillus sp. FSL E2-0178 TaxID=2921361 RepID=UPI0031586460
MVNRGINTDEVAEPGASAIEGVIAASSEGQPWLDALLEYLMVNKQWIECFMATELPELKVIHSETTYLAWIDCTAVTNDSKALCGFIRKETGLYISEGAIFGRNGQG